MSFGLLRKDESIHLSCQGWFQAMRLAKMHGWKPAGPEGNYETNDGQTVCEEEAVSMGEALKNALPDIPDEDVLSIKGPVFLGDQVNPVLVVQWA